MRLSLASCLKIISNKLGLPLLFIVKSNTESRKQDFIGFVFKINLPHEFESNIPLFDSTNKYPVYVRHEIKRVKLVILVCYLELSQKQTSSMYVRCCIRLIYMKRMPLPSIGDAILWAG